MVLQPPEGFEWKQKDAGKLRCINCGEVVNAVAVDLHSCSDNTKTRENHQANRMF